MYKRQLLLLLLITGCGTADYEEKAQDTIYHLQEIEEADKALGAPVKFKETKDPVGNIITRDVFLRLPLEMYNDLSKVDAEQGKGYRLFNKYTKAKGGADIPRMVMLAFADESDGNQFKDEFLAAMGVKEQKGTKPSFKVKDDVDVLRFEVRGHERTIIFLFPAEKIGVAFQFDTTPGQDARQDATVGRSMKFFRLNSGAEDARNKYELGKSAKGN